MLDFIKFDGAFGIKKLNNCELLGKKPVTVVYSPNGTMKSSFSDAMRSIKMGDQCGDIFSGVPADYEIVTSDGTHITPATVNPPLNIVVFSGGEEFNYANSDPDMPKLVVSSSFRALLSKQSSIIDAQTTVGENLIESVFQIKGKPVKNLESALSVMAEKPGLSGKALYRWIISNIGFLLIKPVQFKVTPQNFVDSANDKIKKWASDPAVAPNVAAYASLIGKASSLPIFKNGFSLNDLEDVVGNCGDKHYFDAGHQLYMNGKAYGKEELDALIKAETEKVYGSPEAKAAFDKAAGTLDKNPQTRKFAPFLNANPQLAGKLVDFEELMKELFVTVLGKDVQTLAQCRAEIGKAESEIKRLASDSAIDNTQIHGIWRKFESRFSFDKFDLVIENKVEAVSGAEFPTFVKKVKGTNTTISDPKTCRLSTGEIRSYYLINLIIEVELMKLKNMPFCLILDDVADSFDYKNKYGIIEYLDEIARDPNAQVIALTHNFDFFRSLILSLGSSSVTQLFAYKDSKNEVTLYDVSGKHYYLELSKFNDWSANPTVEEMIAEIPFIRNILQFETNSSNPGVQSLDCYLHYDGQLSETLDFNVLSSVLAGTKRQRATMIGASDHYLKTLLGTVSAIVNSPNGVNETELSYKITMGIFIRVFMERVMHKIIADNGRVFSNNANPYNRTKSLFDVAKSYMSPDQISHFYEAEVISPSLVHANSFMYEPLIDVGSNALVSMTKWLIKENSQWAVI